MREDPEVKFVALRIDHFLAGLGVVQVKIEDEPIDYSECPRSIHESPVGKSEATVKTRLSSLNINLGENKLYFRRKNSSNQGILTGIKLDSNESTN